MRALALQPLHACMTNGELFSGDNLCHNPSTSSHLNTRMGIQTPTGLKFVFLPSTWSTSLVFSEIVSHTSSNDASPVPACSDYPGSPDEN